MVKRVTFFCAWAIIGFVWGFELLYLFTPLGWPPLILALWATWLLRRHGLNEQPEIWGLLAGIGLFALWIGTSVDEPQVWIAAGTGTTAMAIVAFTISGRARCARAA
jgi:hypothetical protein